MRLRKLRASDYEWSDVLTFWHSERCSVMENEWNTWKTKIYQPWPAGTRIKLNVQLNLPSNKHMALEILSAVIDGIYSAFSGLAAQFWNHCTCKLLQPAPHLQEWWAQKCPSTASLERLSTQHLTSKARRKSWKYRCPSQLGTFWRITFHSSISLTAVKYSWRWVYLPAEKQVLMFTRALPESRSCRIDQGIYTATRTILHCSTFYPFFQFYTIFSLQKNHSLTCTISICYLTDPLH